MITEPIGYGLDALDDKTRRHYPMSYAFYARGLAELYRRPSEPQCLDRLNETLQKLLDLQLSPGAWGLPLAWEGRVDEPYLIITAFVLHALLDGYELTGNENYFKAVENGIDWGINRLGKLPNGCFKYSPRIDMVICNPHAAFMGVLYHYLDFKEDKVVRDEAEKALQYLDTKRTSEGLYGYRDKTPRRFCFHTSYVLEGLHYAGRDIKASWNTLINKLMKPNGYMIASTVNKVEARAWAYATHLYVGSLINDTKYNPTILNYVHENLMTLSGLYYKSDDPRIFTRHEAHMFYALVKLGKLRVRIIGDKFVV